MLHNYVAEKFSIFPWNFFLSLFQIHSFKLLIPATSGLCAECMEHWIFALRGFCPHFFTSLSKIFAIIDVDPSNIIIPSFWFRPKVTSVPKAWSTETTLWDGFVSISSHRCPKFSQPLMLTLPTSFFQASNSGHTWFLRRRHRALKPRFERVLSAFPHIVVQNFGNNKLRFFRELYSEVGFRMPNYVKIVRKTVT